MGMVHWSLWLLLALAANQLSADDLPPGVIRVADLPGKDFESIQAAILESPQDGVIYIGAGRYDERLKITKPVKLVGSGTNKTVIGPTAAVRDQQHKRFRAAADIINRETSPGNNPVEVQRFFEEFKVLAAQFVESIIVIENVQGIELRSLRVTSPGTPQGGEGLVDSRTIKLSHGGLRMVDCVVVGCLGYGVHAEAGSNLEIDDCLIAGCWSSGVAVMNHEPGQLRIVNSDIRNCYHNNIWTGSLSNPCTIEGCRISGSAWFGINYADHQTTIKRNAIFENARCGIYNVRGDGIVRENVFYKNAMGGAACFFEGKTQFESNLFIENEGAGIYVNGPCDPEIRGNVFIGNSFAVDYGPIKLPKTTLQPIGEFRVTDNFFWKIDSPVVRSHLTEKLNERRHEPVELPPDANNRIEDPEVAINLDRKVVLGLDSPARQFDVAGVTSVAFNSRWPITDEERAMIPEDGTRDSSKWKMKYR